MKIDEAKEMLLQKPENARLIVTEREKPSGISGEFKWR